MPCFWTAVETRRHTLTKRRKAHMSDQRTPPSTPHRPERADSEYSLKTPALDHEPDPGPPPPRDSAEETFARIMEAARDADRPLAELRGLFPAASGLSLREAAENRAAGLPPEEGASAPPFAANARELDAEGNPAWISIHVPDSRYDPRYADGKSSLSFSAAPKGLLNRWRKDTDGQKPAGGPGPAAGKNRRPEDETPRSRRPGFLSILIWGCLAGLAILAVSGRGCSLVNKLL